MLCRIPDDLALRLQNVGTHVRKCVNEGYKTQLQGFTSSFPLAPFNSPVKSLACPSSANAYSPSASPFRTMPAPQIFKTANEAILEAINSPSRATSSNTPHHNVQRKRGRDEDDDEPINDHSVRRQLFASKDSEVDADGDIGMDEAMDEDNEEEDVEFFLGHNNGLPNRHTRPMKPLRKGSPEMYIPPSQSSQESGRTFSTQLESNDSKDLTFLSPVLSSAVSDITAHMRGVVDSSNDELRVLPSLTPDMFNENF
ncbi:hypothetical protein SCHPADRAFT_643757 [Schizopora paradoxa]|uniref:Uncharacterized protein n=1 Tax=Schizopora paradoxa TaxID=27342 RepID=A0A0H2R6R4_9AGAM|nr:hypothetical protein SCHPADRAFT_643757 [Schizopora paradoxa]